MAREPGSGNAEQATPLAGLTVLELCSNVAGPYAGLILATLGARVIKVERPGKGDDARSWGPPFWGSESVMFAVMNAGKESVALDLSDEDDRRTLLALADDADVMLANWRPGSLERLGLGADDLRRDRPRLIYCTVSSFGSQGPLADARGYDPLIQAFCGLMAITGEADGEPVRVGTSIIDMGAGIWAALAVLAALRERDETGVGAHITGSLLETGLAWLPYQAVGYLATGEEPRRLGSAMAMLVPYQAFPTADGHLVVAVGNDRQWLALCNAVERKDLAEDPTLATNPQRVASRESVVAELTGALSSRTARDWESVLQANGVPCSVVQAVGSALAHAQTQALEMYAPVADARMEGLALPGLPFRLDGVRPRPARAHPDLDSDERGR